MGLELGGVKALEHGRGKRVVARAGDEPVLLDNVSTARHMVDEVLRAGIVDRAVVTQSALPAVAR